MDRWIFKAARDSMAIATALGIPATVLSGSLSRALSAGRPGALYVVTVILAVVTTVLVRLVFAMQERVRILRGEQAKGIEKAKPSDRLSLADVIQGAREEVVFFGVSAKRTVTEDGFRRSLELPENRNLRLRFLLLDPSSSAFEQRARDEGEPADTWRADIRTTIARLAACKAGRNMDIRVRFSSEYPIWRGMMVDRDRIFVSVFLPGRRGTEADQYAMSRVDEELGYGIGKCVQLSWKNAREVRL